MSTKKIFKQNDELWQEIHVEHDDDCIPHVDHDETIDNEIDPSFVWQWYWEYSNVYLPNWSYWRNNSLIVLLIHLEHCAESLLTRWERRFREFVENIFSLLFYHSRWYIKRFVWEYPNCSLMPLEDKDYDRLKGILHLLASPDSCTGNGSILSPSNSLPLLLLWYKTMRSRFSPGIRVG